MPYKDPNAAKAHRKAYYAANREAALRKSREWRLANPERYRAQGRASYARHHQDAELMEKRRQWTLRWRENNPDKIAAYREQAVAINRARALEFARAHPEQNRASKAVGYAVRTGKMIRPSVCERCGKEGKIEAAHHDYSKPLDVRWLCRSCHRSWDKRDPKLSQLPS